ncbi:histidine kinase-like ATPase [Neohortaea acidophila]|uniref:Histidine kinase-like ATPase n=1 Tax=Neohortaea acidophila TaxID=245834 RepID=A0A6A6PR54_9PEZI|nr:histidine kinase-like ATPase [Neohortaea acidophila]KAF2482608.1 histidine kinase-like ATPase [Neohortaea acidophila]
MGIQTLPQSTVRTLGASQVLNEPASVVKELLENALDAHATSVSIEISANTLDTILVRDNGHGIPPPDRHLIARPHCTSKISGEDDLHSIGGTSLGFRGEALASVADMSGSLSISTRVEGEQVATVLKIDQRGEVEGTDRASLPVGTTVKITDFLKSHPVRRQIVLKDTEKCFKKIKRMLQAYVFTRPNVRLSLRVLKAKNDKANWTYAPKTGGSVEDAALKVLGSACASQCEWSVLECQGFTVQALLPRLDADAHKVSNTGAFLSIDRRPVSTARGTPKQIIKLFREALKSTGSAWEGVKEPFIYLDISCPQRSYDANVEPAKDDVLFENPDQIFDVVRKLMTTAYPVQEPRSHRIRSLRTAFRRRRLLHLT